MKCSQCKIKEANTLIKKNINGRINEIFLCSDCAKSIEKDDLESINSFVKSVFSTTEENTLSSIGRCKNCGTTYNEIINTGKVGCANCYAFFEDELAPNIEKLHGNLMHVGKEISSKTNPVYQNKSFDVSLSELKNDLKIAIKEERFEDAIILRDKINSISKGSDSNE